MPRPIRSTSRLLALLLAAAVAGCSSTTQLDLVTAQLDEVQTQLRQLQLEVSSKEEFTTLASTLERDSAALLRSQADTMDLIRQLRTSMVELQAAIGTQQVDLRELHLELADLDEQIESLRNSLAEQEQAANPYLEISDPAGLYQASYDDFQDRNYELALAGFRRFVELFPSHSQTDSALYWIGECYLNRGQFREAIREFNAVADRFPGSSRLATTLLRKSEAYRQLGETGQARQLLRDVIATYPNSDEAVLAQQRLDNGS